jgi:hypothetical protein
VATGEQTDQQRFSQVALPDDLGRERLGDVFDQTAGTVEFALVRLCSRGSHTCAGIPRCRSFTRQLPARTS